MVPRTRRKTLIGVVVAVMLAEVIATAPNIDFAVDARVYYGTAQHLVRNEPIYVEAPRRNPYDVTSTFLYPPVFAAVLRPVAFLEYRTFVVFWYAILTLAALALSLALATLFFGARTAKTVLMSMAMLALTPGVEASFAIGNADLVVWALAAFALIVPSPTPLLVAAIAKVYPIPAWAVLTIRSKRLPSISSVVVIGAFLCYAFVTVDAVAWIRDGVPALTSGNFTFYNWSFSTFPLRYLASGEHLLAPAFRTYLSVTSIVAPLVVAYLARRTSVRLHTTLVLLASTAFAPLCWWYRLPIALLLVFASVVADARPVSFVGGPASRQPSSS